MGTMKKITTGFVIQDVDTKTGICTGQSFIAGDQVDWEDEWGDYIEEPANAEYFPFQMEQPDPLDNLVRGVRP